MDKLAREGFEATARVLENLCLALEETERELRRLEKRIVKLEVVNDNNCKDNS